MVESRYQIVADRLIAYWGGEIAGQETREALRQLDDRIDRKVAEKEEFQEPWRLARRAPEEHRRLIGQTLATLAKSDSVTGHLVSILAPQGPVPKTTGPRLRYEDFAIEIASGDGGEWTVRVLDSPEGGGRAKFSPPFVDAESESLIRAIELSVRRSGERTVRPAGRRSRPAASEPQELGKRLFTALFQGSIRDRWVASLARIGEQPDRGLRLRLVFALGAQPGLAAIGALPWELLCHPETGDFLARDVRTPLVRFLDVPRATVPAPAAPPLRVLLVPANLADRPLELAREHERIATEWSALRSVCVETVEANPERLRERLRSKDYHVLHFMGHGDFADQGELLFDAGDGTAAPVAGRVFGEILRGIVSLRLVVLNACSSGELPRRDGLDPYSGVASALVAAGLPAVLAMQFPISDVAAVTFSETLYRRLAAGDPLEAAVAEGRLAVHCADPDSLEWATPVLYQRVLDRGLIRNLVPR